MFNKSTANKISLLIIAGLSSSTVYAKSCYFNTLSKLYSYQLITQESNQIQNHPITTVEVVIANKVNNHILQAFSFMQENTHLPNITCSARSYITHYETNKRVVNGDYGNLVIGDFKFNGKEGIAVASEVVEGKGVRYKFYFQNKNGKWAEQTNFLTPNRDAFAAPFPAEINPKKKALAFISRPDAGHPTTTTTYQLDDKSGKWHSKITTNTIKKAVKTAIKSNAKPHHNVKAHLAKIR